MTRIIGISVAFIIAALTLSACCCTSNGIDPPQPHQFENITPAKSDT